MKQKLQQGKHGSHMNKTQNYTQPIMKVLHLKYFY